MLGTRPEAIKLCPVIHALRRRGRLEPVVCATAQHRTMLDQVLPIFGVAPDVDLDLMEARQTLAGFTARAVAALDAWLATQAFRWLVVQGDTTTALCAALAAFYRGIPVAHVEAGLRTGQMDQPFPEEMNRVLVSRLATLHFAPTERARQNLLREGIADERVVVTGNTAVDALLRVAALIRNDGEKPAGLADVGRFVLITGHRRESFGEGFRAICDAVSELAERFPEITFVYPVHLNPNVRGPVFELLAGRRNVRLLEPLDYRTFVALMDRCSLILTDSGGIQEEAPSLGKPVLVMRSVTERPEAVEAGLAELVGTDARRIVERVTGYLSGSVAAATAPNPFGDGHASERIAEALEAVCAP